MRKNVNCPSGQDGIIAVNQIDEKTYRNAEGLNKSLLVKFMKSPRHYLAALNEKTEPTDSMKIGTALHARLFRDNPENEFVVKKKVDGRTADGKAYNAKFDTESQGRVVINEEQNALVGGMFDSLMKNPRFKKMHDKTTHSEFGIFADYKNKDYNFRIKGMLDGYIENDGVIYDVKSSQDPHPDVWRWDFKKYQYDLQQVHYTHLLGLTGLPFKEFVFVVVESKPPHEVAFYTLSVPSFIKAKSTWESAMDFFGHCHQKQDFDIGYSNETIEL